MKQPYYLDKKFTERFFSRVIQTNECWIWIGYKNYDGYRTVNCGVKNNRTHRVSWEIFNKKSVPGGLSILHFCDNPPCVNPSHLKLGTQIENVQDMVRKKRFNTVVKGGDLAPSKKLNSSIVAQIRLLISQKANQYDIAKKFKTSQANISL